MPGCSLRGWSMPTATSNSPICWGRSPNGVVLRGLPVRFSAEQRVQAVEAADAAMWQAGIEAVGDISNGDTAFAVKSRSRIAYHTFVEFFGLRAASAEHLLPLLRHPQTSLTPHSLYSVQDAPLRAIAARGDAPLSIHFMESPGEAALFEHRGPLWEWYAKAGFSCDFLHYGSPAELRAARPPRDPGA